MSPPIFVRSAEEIDKIPESRGRTRIEVKTGLSNRERRKIWGAIRSKGFLTVINEKDIAPRPPRTAEERYAIFHRPPTEVKDDPKVEADDLEVVQPYTPYWLEPQDLGVVVPRDEEDNMVVDSNAAKLSRAAVKLNEENDDRTAKLSKAAAKLSKAAAKLSKVDNEGWSDAMLIKAATKLTKAAVKLTKAAAKLTEAAANVNKQDLCSKRTTRV